MTLRFVYVLCLLAICVQAADQPDLLRPFLKTYCTQCHGPEKQKGDRRFDKLTGDFTQLKEAETFQEILDQLNLAEMPPEGEKQPAPAEVRRVVEHLTKSLSQARVAARQNTGKVVLRRLNRVEYLNTVRDLFMLKMVDFDPTTTFPPDDPLDGFDNVGEGLVASDHLLQNYLEAARKVADKAIRPGPRPEMIRYSIGGEAKPDVNRVILNGVGIDKVARREAARLFIKFRQPLGLPLLDKKRGVPADGEYVIRFSAQAIRRKSRYKDSKICVIIPMSRCGFQFPSIPAHWEQPPIGSLANTKFPMIRWLKLNIGFGWKRDSPFTCIGPMGPMDPSSVSCERFCPSITRMRSIPCVTHLRCTWVQGLNSTFTRSALRVLFMKSGPCQVLIGSFQTRPWCPACGISA